MADAFDTNIIDTFRSHKYHQSYHSNCSTCYSEDRLIKAKKTVTKEKVCRLGHVCTSMCVDKGCPCNEEHCCDMSASPCGEVEYCEYCKNKQYEKTF